MRVYGLYWNRRGELYNVTPVLPEDVRNFVQPTCRIENLSTGSSSIQTCEQALDHHLSVGWFHKATQDDLDSAFKNAQERITR